MDGCFNRMFHPADHPSQINLGTWMYRRSHIIYYQGEQFVKVHFHIQCLAPVSLSQSPVQDHLILDTQSIVSNSIRSESISHSVVFDFLQPQGL